MLAVLFHSCSEAASQSGPKPGGFVKTEVTALKVLVADDDEDDRSFVAIILRGMGCHVDTVVDGTTALEHALLTEYDAVVLDIDMPGLSGLEVTEALRSVPGSASLLIVISSSRSTAFDLERGWAAGADEYLCKPVSPAGLRACFRAA